MTSPAAVIFSVFVCVFAFLLHIFFCFCVGFGTINKHTAQKRKEKNESEMGDCLIMMMMMIIKRERRQVRIYF